MRRDGFWIAAMLLAFAFGATADEKAGSFASSANGLTVSSDSVGSLVLGKKVKLMMRDGTLVEGRVIQASPHSITLKVSKSEPKKRIAGREASIATAEIGAIHLSKSGTIAAPVALGVVCGWLGGAAAAYASESFQHAGAAVGMIVLGLAGGATGGALAGRELARHTVILSVVPAGKP